MAFYFSSHQGSTAPAGLVFRDLAGFFRMIDTRGQGQSGNFALKQADGSIQPCRPAEPSPNSVHLRLNQVCLGTTIRTDPWSKRGPKPYLCHEKGAVGDVLGPAALSDETKS